MVCMLIIPATKKTEIGVSRSKANLDEGMRSYLKNKAKRAGSIT
jgi:hypothetical protein